MATGKDIIPLAQVTRAILVIRGQRVLLDSDLARLYGVTTGNLNKAVTRNRDRFPADFMLQLTAEDMEILIFQFGISSWGGRRRLPYEGKSRDRLSCPREDASLPDT